MINTKYKQSHSISSIEIQSDYAILIKNEKLKSE